MKNRVTTAGALLLFAILHVAAGATLAQAQAQGQLQSYQADASQTSVSGLSSGAFMAAQFQVAFSSTIVGAGIIAGGPFYCVGTGTLPGMPFLINALATCGRPLSGMAPNPALSLSSAKIFSQLDLIDDPVHLKRQRTYLYSATDDRTVTTSVVAQAAAFYKLAEVPAKNILYVHHEAAGHAILTNNVADAVCGSTGAPFINNCGYMQSERLLSHIYGKLNPPAARLGGKLIEFDQGEFFSSDKASMSAAAHVYVPNACESQVCKVHIAFHGCKQGDGGLAGDKFYRITGYNEIADTNRLIVLYPQVRAATVPLTNDDGCWDFWGYSSPDPTAPNFYSRKAPQMAAVKAMLDRLSQPRRASAATADSD